MCVNDANVLIRGTGSGIIVTTIKVDAVVSGCPATELPRELITRKVVQQRNRAMRLRAACKRHGTAQNGTARVPEPMGEATELQNYRCRGGIAAPCPLIRR